MTDFAKLKEDVSTNLCDTKDELNVAAEKLNRKLEAAKALLDKLSRRSKILLDQNYNWQGKNISVAADELWLCQVDEITFVDKAPQKECVENILGTFRGLREFNFVYLILGDGQRVRFYLGVVRNKFYPGKCRFQVTDIGENLLKPAIEGNFRGCKLRNVPASTDEQSAHNLQDKQKILNMLRDPKFTAGIIEGIPGTDLQKNISEGKKENFQGIDRLIDVMQDCKFGLAVIACPCSSMTADSLSCDLFSATDMLSALKISVQHSRNKNVSFNDNASASANTQSSDSIQDIKSDNYTYSENSGSDSRRDVSNQITKSEGETYTDQKNHSKSFDYSKDIGNGGKDRQTTHDAADVQNKSSQKATGKNYNYTVSENKLVSKNESHQHSDSASYTKGKNNSVSKSNQLVAGEAVTIAFGATRQLETGPKLSSDWLKYIDEVLLPRIDSGNGKGIFNVCMYAFAENEISFRRLTNTAVSLFTGSKGNKEALHFISFDRVRGDDDCKAAFRNLQIPAAEIKLSGTPYETLVSRITERKSDDIGLIFCGHWMATNELSLITGFPQKEIVGLKLREEVEFGLNVEPVPDDCAIKLGYLVRSGVEKKNIPVNLDKRDLDKHAFISGVTGSGKTTTCQNILMGCDLPFLVIEPAKTEYRAIQAGDFSKRGEIVYFTPGKQNIAPFFMNPFELFPDEEISARADMLTATFEASFEMEAAIPQILETAIYRTYRNKGWNVANSTWQNKSKNAPFADGVYAFPTLSDFKVAVKSVILSQGFDDRLRDEYLGSINARIESLMVGAKGQMLNTPRSINFADLVRRQVVIELEEIKSSAEKSLLMGLILTNLLQAVKLVKRQDKNFRHITLIEEAHRLLSKYVPGDNRNRKKGVEVFANMLAEVRKYGESLIIADQIPDKMTPEVLKNTSTKIVHKLFAKDDKDSIGNTISLTEEQKNFLSNLQPGRAVVFSQGWDKAIQVQVFKRSITDANDIAEQEIRRRSLNYYSLPEIARSGVVPGLEKIPASKLSVAVAEKFLWLNQQSYAWLNELTSRITEIVSDVTPHDVDDRHFEIAEGMHDICQKFDKDFVTQYIELRLKDYIGKPEIFRSELLQLLGRLENSSSTADWTKMVQDFISQTYLQGFCKLPTRRNI